MDVPGLYQVVIVEHQYDVTAHGPKLVEQRCVYRFDRGRLGDSSSPSVSAPTSGSAVWSAAITFAQNEAGLSSV